MIVADSDVLIDALRGVEPMRSRVEVELRTQSFGTTVVTVFELLSGAVTARERERVEALFAAMRILRLDDAAARAAAELRRELTQAGQGLATADYLIAGICLSQSAMLLTRNRKHFERVPGLALATSD